MRIDWMLANVDMFHEASRYMRSSRSTGNVGFLLLAISALVLFWWGVQYLDKFRTARPGHSRTPKDLFYDLCRLHELSRPQRRLLLTAAARLPSQELARVFVDPSILGALAVSNAAEAEAYSQLLTKIHGERRGMR
jgi:hypothetical protein